MTQAFLLSEHNFEGNIFQLDGPWEPAKSKLKTANSKPNPKIQFLNVLEKQNVIDLLEKRWLESQKMRREAVRRYCDNHKELAIPFDNWRPYDTQQFYKTVLVGSKHQTLYCPVGKVACTSWKTTMAMLQGHYDGLRPGEHIHDLDVLIRNDVTPLRMSREPRKLLENSAIFLFVRHPFERLVSAYKNKILSTNKDVQLLYGRDIVRRYRKGTSSDPDSSPVVKCHEFIKWI